MSGTEPPGKGSQAGGPEKRCAPLAHALLGKDGAYSYGIEKGSEQGSERPQEESCFQSWSDMYWAKNEIFSGFWSSPSLRGERPSRGLF